MNTKPPVAPPASASVDDGGAATVAALQRAAADTTLPMHVRLLLLQAGSALLDAGAATEAASKRYRALFDAVPDPISIIGWDETILDLNHAAIVAFSRPRDQLIGQTIRAINPDLPRDHMGPVREALGRGGTYVVEVTNMRADGTRFPVEVHSANFDYDGRPCVVAVARDLSGRREAELRYRELMETIDKGILVRDASGHIVYGNPAMLRMLGVEPGLSLDQELTPERWMVVDEHGAEIPDDDVPARRALRTGDTVASTVLGFYHRERRQLTWFSVTSVPQFGPGSDSPQQVLSLFTDVTALKRDSALFDRVQNLAHIGGWEWDAGRDHVHLTGAAQQILGLAAAPATMADLQAPLRDVERRRLQDALQRALEHGDGFDLELQGTGVAGHAIWVRLIGEAVAGDPTGARLTGTLQDITERKQAEETLRVQARTDPLTGLLNRDAVLVELAARLDDPVQAGVAVLYIDLDRFKVVNDVLGHAAGDQVIAHAAKRIQRAIGTEGLIARFGGDEFLVVCGTADDGARPERMATSILRAFGDSFQMSGEEFTITASIGIARAPDHGERPQALIQNADVAMYDSKRRNRNGWQSFSPELARQQQQRLQLETNLRRAVDNAELRLAYQPQVDLHTGRIVGAEALLRWRNASLGDMYPGQFIGHAETTGDIVRIGGWVLREACRQLRCWHDAGLALPRIAVNVSYRQFLAEDLAEGVAAALAETGLPGEALELEFTERVLIEDEPATLATFAALRSLGVALSIDDFGEGYSALNYLRRLPIHGLKLSQQFLQGVPDNTSDVAICQAVAGIAQSLGLGLVAEGVESEAQRQFLLRMGVRSGQGFLFAQGLPPQEFATLFSRPHLLPHA